MSLEKAIKHGKEKRKSYPGNDSRNVDWSCRNHKSCPWCKRQRLHNSIKTDKESQQDLDDYWTDPEEEEDEDSNE